MGRFTQLTIAVAIVAGAIAAPATAEEAGNPAEGQRLALKVCSFCHVVSSEQQFAPTLRNPAPGFGAIANKPGTTAESLRRFLVATHATIAEPANMPNPRLTDQQVIDIVSYILSLRSPQAGTKGGS
jgi:mono/diheme cytochrome c family protein